jgi:5S rRNA maturation endonuclease (ribonuclease M5)
MNVSQLVSGTFIKAGNEYHMPCFLCGGKDRFVLFHDGKWWCRQCQKSGDAIALLMQRDGMTYTDACARLGETPKEKATTTPPRPTLRVSQPKEQSHNVQAWRETAQRMWERAHDCLYADQHLSVIQYLKKRGFDARILTHAGLAYVPKSFNAVWGGLPVYPQNGILIKWYEGRDTLPYKLNIRVENPTPGKPRYQAVSGSMNGIFESWRIRPQTTVVLCEGEFDALSVTQGTDYKALGVATGSTMSGRLPFYIARLALARRVFVAFDQDDAGEKASEYWLSVLPNAIRLIPTAHDCNEMLQNKHDFMNWLSTAERN